VIGEVTERGQSDHRVVETWRGEEVETLEDLLRPGLRAVCIGINPSLVSVAAGHYYQGRLGKLFFSAFRKWGFWARASREAKMTLRLLPGFASRTSSSALRPGLTI
jgi:ribosomal protein L21E